jgi:PAS domain S-box-containing protein
LVYEFQVHQIELELQNEELKHSQQEVMLAHDRYKKLYNLSPAAYVSLTETGIITAANTAAAILFRVSCDHLLNKKLGQFIHALDQDTLYFFLQDLVTKQTDQRVTVRLTKPIEGINISCEGMIYCQCTPANCIQNNTHTHIELRGNYADADEDNACVNLSLIDVTEAKNRHEKTLCLNKKLEQLVVIKTRALTEINLNLVKQLDQQEVYQQQLLKQELKLNAIFNAAVEGIVTLDTRGHIVSANSAIEYIFDYDTGELIGCPINTLILMANDSNDEPSPANIADNPFFNLIDNVKEAIGIRKNGFHVPLEFSIAKYPFNETTYLTLIIRDITVRKYHQQREKEHLDALSHVTRLGLMGEMVSGIAHQMNQPLTVIANYSQTCLNLAAKPSVDRERLTRNLKKSCEQALKAGKIMHSMLAFVKFKTHPENTDINGLIRDAVELCDSAIRKGHVIVKLELAEDLPLLFIDAIQVQQVILNLIKNALDVLTAQPLPALRHLDIESHLIENDMIEVRIKDNGAGIDRDAQKSVLSPFYTTKSDGMGMGLSICLRIIEAHEGTLRFNSQLGKGSTFYFTLPVKRHLHDR